MIDIFDKLPIDLNKLTCHSGGAEGYDTYFEKIGEKYGVKTKAYSYKTSHHSSKNKVEISEDDFNEGKKMVQRANRTLKRYGISKYINLLSRNWCQVKYSDEIFAIGYIIEPKSKGNKGYYNKSEFQIVDGGTGYATQMGIDANKLVNVFDKNKNKWFRWSYTSLKFIEIKEPVISCQNFAGIGTRKINSNGINAIKNLYKKTFKN